MRTQEIDEELKKILDKARERGACSKIDEISTWKMLLDAFFTPYGVEFMQKKSFPTIRLFRKHKARLFARRIFVDDGEFCGANMPCIGAIGKTIANIKYSGVDSLNTVVVMHGAEVNIEACKYAVIKIYNIGGKVNIKKDKTVRIL